MQHDNLLAQHKLLLAIIATDWATRLDHKVAAVIIERYFRKYACARVSLRYLQQATGATRSNIITSLRRLLENGAFSLIREGAGTRPTEYGLNFAFSSSGIVGSTSSDGERSGLVGDTACGIAGDTSNVASGIDPPPLNGSTLKYGFDHEGGPQWQTSDTSPTRSSRSFGR